MHRPPGDDEWFVPEYRQGEDPMWDQLGDDWHAIDGVLDVRLYVKWEKGDALRARLNGLCIADHPVTADTLRSIPIGRLESLPAAPEMTGEQYATELERLVRGKGDDPEEFAERVALYYRLFTTITNKPAKAIAEHSDVPVATVRGWIREARLRGKLPPGMRGKAG